MDSLSGKKIWLIGASVGIGEAVARQLAKAGARLVLSARSEDKITALISQLPGGPHLSLPMDVTDIASVKKAWAVLTASWGTIDILFYNAGAYEPMSALRFDLGKVEDMLDVNFHGALRVLGVTLPPFIEKRGGHIVLVASVAGYAGLPNAIGYGASKAALLHLAENLRLDLAPRNIKVQVVSPGFVKTRLTDKNNFHMPFMISPEKAAQHIVNGLLQNRFEIHFPKQLSMMLKFLRCLPYSLYFRILKKQ